MRRNVSAISISLALLGAGCSGSDTPESVLPGVSAIVFAKRGIERGDGTEEVTGGNGRVVDYQRYVPDPRAGVFVLSPPTPDGELRNLTAAFEEVDVNGLDVSFDARQAVFSMRRKGDSNFHLYVANVDGTGEVRQLTFGNHDDIGPIFLPGDRIAFVTNQAYTPMGTRADEYNHSRAVTQIATISLAGGDADRRLCSQNLSHSANPFLLSDGRIGFSRWEHLGPVNDVKLFAMNPDCTQMVALAGQHGKPFNSLVQVVEQSEGRYIGIATSRDGTIQAGALYAIDARSRGGAAGIALDEQAATFEPITPAVPTDEETPPTNVGRYRSVRPLPGSDALITSWANGPVNERLELAGTAPGFGIYRYDVSSRERTLIYDDPSMWDLYAIPLVVRDAPPVRTPVVGPQPDPSVPAVLGSVDITQTSLNETVRGGTLDGMSLATALAHADQVRVIEGFSSEIGSVNMFGLTMHEGAAILGEVPVYADGSWEASVPPYLMYHLQPIDEFGLAIRNQMTWIQAMPGESRRCGGCHEGRATTVSPRMGPTTMAQQAGPIDLNQPIAARMELPWHNAPTSDGRSSHGSVQALLDEKCVSCHDGGAMDPFRGRFYTVNVTSMDGEMLTYQIPYLELTDRPVEAYYEEMTTSYPASYVSLLYPSAMMGDSMAVGDVAPEWVIPGDARSSRLIEKVNAESRTRPGQFAFPGAPHPEDVGVTLTREERMMLVRSADLGGQYYSRRNVEGASYEWDTYR